MPIGQQMYADAARAVFERIVDTQQDAIQTAADVLTEVIRRDGIIHAFGTGHSQGLALEVAGRAGGLVPTNRMAIKDLVLHGGAAPEEVLDPKIERDPSIAARIWDLHTVHPADGFIVGSHSGGNGATVEMARLAGVRGHPVIAVTSMDHTSRIVSRHPSGAKLFEVADVVIDNCAPYGDGVLELSSGIQVCAVSSISNALIVQMLVADIVGRISTEIGTPPVYISANVPDGDRHNEALIERYRGRIMEHEP